MKTIRLVKKYLYLMTFAINKQNKIEIFRSKLLHTLQHFVITDMVQYKRIQ